MKSNIKHEDIWWEYTETCDKCGKEITMKTTEEPDTQEADFCVHCMLCFIGNNIPYETAKEQYSMQKILKTLRDSLFIT